MKVFKLGGGSTSKTPKDRGHYRLSLIAENGAQHYAVTDTLLAAYRLIHRWLCGVCLKDDVFVCAKKRAFIANENYLPWMTALQGEVTVRIFSDDRQVTGRELAEVAAECLAIHESRKINEQKRIARLDRDYENMRNKALKPTLDLGDDE